MLTLEALITVAGVGQIGLAIGSLAIPNALRWRDHTAVLPALTRQVFWTYAGYIWVINLCFGALSLLAPRILITGETLARLVAGFIACYWGARFAIQFVYFDRSAAPAGLRFRVAEWALVGLFGYLTAVYGWIALVA